MKSETGNAHLRVEMESRYMSYSLVKERPWAEHLTS